MTAQVERLPVEGLCALAIAGFVTILTETLPAGLLPQIGGSLGVSEAMAGKWISIYALPPTIGEGWISRWIPAEVRHCVSPCDLSRGRAWL
jgi:predicted MFS family arabinose efflux permease